MGQTELDQLTRIFFIIGTPNVSEWPTETNVLRSNFVTSVRKDLSTFIPNIAPLAKDLISVSNSLSLNFRLLGHVIIILKFLE